MGILKGHIAHLKKLSKGLDKVAFGVVETHSEKIMDVVRNEQLGKGIDSFGFGLVHPSKKTNPARVPLYEPATEFFWAKRSPYPIKPKKTNARYNFQWTGNFFNSLAIKKERDGYNIFSKTGKQRLLEKIYETKLTKLTNDNNKMVNDNIILPEVYKYVVNNLFEK